MSANKNCECVWYSTDNTCIAPIDERAKKGCIKNKLYTISEIHLIRLEQLGTGDYGDTEARDICEYIRRNIVQQEPTCEDSCKRKQCPQKYCCCECDGELDEQKV
jgi:hypothetical protein